MPGRPERRRRRLHIGAGVPPAFVSSTTFTGVPPCHAFLGAYSTTRPNPAKGAEVPIIGELRHCRGVFVALTLVAQLGMSRSLPDTPCEILGEFLVDPCL